MTTSYSNHDNSNNKNDNYCKSNSSSIINDDIGDDDDELQQALELSMVMRANQVSKDVDNNSIGSSSCSINSISNKIVSEWRKILDCKSTMMGFSIKELKILSKHMMNNHDDKCAVDYANNRTNIGADEGSSSSSSSSDSKQLKLSFKLPNGNQKYNHTYENSTSVLTIMMNVIDQVYFLSCI